MRVEYVKKAPTAVAPVMMPPAPVPAAPMHVAHYPQAYGLYCCPVPHKPHHHAYHHGYHLYPHHYHHHHHGYHDHPGCCLHGTHAGWHDEWMLRKKIK